MQEAPSRVEIIKSSNLLNGLTEDQVAQIAVNSRVAHAEKGEMIWLDGSSISFFGVVGKGFVKMTRTTSAGQEITTEIMGPGQVFGLLGVIEGTGCPQSAKAICATWFLKVQRNAILPIYHNNVVLKEHIIRRTTTRLQQSYDMIAHLSVGKVDQRVAAVLLLLSNSYGEEVQSGIQLNVPLTRQDIAELAGTTMESTIRVISRWQKQGLVSTRSQLIFIKDPAALLHLVRGMS